MLELIARFLVVGTLAFGGGQAALPLVERLRWPIRAGSPRRNSLPGSALSYATPGPVLILAAFIGYYVASVPGAFAATAAVFTVPVICAGSPHSGRSPQGNGVVPVVRTVRRRRRRRSARRHPDRAARPLIDLNPLLILAAVIVCCGRAARHPPADPARRRRSSRAPSSQFWSDRAPVLDYPVPFAGLSAARQRDSTARSVSASSRRIGAPRKSAIGRLLPCEASSSRFDSSGRSSRITRSQNG